MKERQQRIYEILNKQGNATVEQLKHAVFASDATIRRDLKKMEQQGLLMRVWGGAVSANKVNCDPPAFVRNNTNINAKKRIAYNAIGLLKNNSSVFLPSGTTVTQFSRLLDAFENLTVITTCPDIIDILKSNSSARVISLGGELYEGYDFAGALTVNNIDNFNADFLFFSCSGITANGFSSNDEVRLDIIQKMQKNSAKTVLLADTSKIGKKFIYKGFGFENIDYVIMEKQPEDKELIKTLGKKLITTKTDKTTH